MINILGIAIILIVIATTVYSYKVMKQSLKKSKLLKQLTQAM
ncbi:hypothetical protein V5N20_13910 [Staphylococcus aureus]|nr:hypothetical protein [Staphylococcus aureus]MDN5238655.1 hypothetical protein [Staphylococcus aureus]MDN5241281.1 hypothetical protein [Staphylococcus aureus]WIL29099.1 hypothetical protein QPR40_14055 [Staphylococcus aureus]